jgi:hypothetical protein
MQSFPTRLPALWRQAFPGLTAGAVAASGWSWLEGEAFSWPQTWPLMLLAAVLVLAMYQLLPTRAGPEGLVLNNAWGGRGRVAWEDIVEARHARLFPLLPAIRVRTQQGRVYWIPRETQNLPGLHTLARSRGGPEHPLTRALEVPMYQL